MRVLQVIRSSIVAQVVLLTTALLLLAALLAIRVERLSRVSPVVLEAGYDMLAIQLIGHAHRGGFDQRAFLASDVVRRTIERNPDLRYFIRDNGHTGGNIQPLDTLEGELRRLRVRSAGLDGLEICQLSSLRRPATRQSGGRYVLYNDCGAASYYIELQNLRHVITMPSNQPNATFTAQFIDVMTGYGSALLLAVLLFAATGLLTFRAFRRVRTAVRGFDFDGGRIEMPVDRFPLEVRPLARIINAQAARVRADFDRQWLFLAAAAHELRTPLAILRVRLEALDDSPEKDDVKHDVQMLARITNQLLDLMRIQYQQQERHAFPLLGVVEEAIDDVRDEFPQHRFRLRQEGEANWRVAGGNAALLGIAVLNLLRNAASVSAPSSPVTAAIGGDGRIRIIDGGPGIPPDIRDYLFEPFVKHPPNRKGSGLGLAITKEIVVFHGGTIDASSPTGGGTVFHVDIRPALRPEDEDADRYEERV
ncbi:HAMP domain-containing histidine kinase [Sphingomonas aliaeris]|uniref:histidine kinase n=1 Tax=Sphingomonas aliaeris TaxID=2759526 RepID=A0A974NUZ2_9SPHN|nr:HAMP domain-containing sensor histidine kinase [Sphingomonas aliaeris]QQV77406.1 HAMP domain-containing histidine kinase [Sphingomonas aliaeris]